MKFHRFNPTEANPNPHVSFITPLKTGDEGTESVALGILKALAAQVRPIMKKHGLEITSFEEYEHNSVFLGRNWNNGEVVEIVLRRGDGSFYSTPHLINVLCHEMSHILHMNHGPSFWLYYHELKREVQALQRANYFGDGFWSSGRVLKDGTEEDRIRQVEDLPEYLCGGAHAKARPTGKSVRKRKARGQAGPSSKRGTTKRKPGTRVRSQNAFKGEGRALNADVDEETRGKLSTGFGKQARSKRARELRAAAIEARLNQSKGQKDDGQPESDGSTTETDDDTEDTVITQETDADRLRLIQSMADDGNKSLRTQSHITDFWMPPTEMKGKSKPVLVVMSDDESDDEEEANERLRKLGLSIEEASEPTSAGPDDDTTPSKPESNTKVLVDHPREKTAEVDGQWACSACTYINPKRLGLVCEVCGTLRRASLATSGDS
ncbi:hypothetical protein M408DRAFT_326031 [Serendipita vermifera MAFF 305830]|uniref:WLM domain-containing protein n=1 Tax=Serendipita vermifera MAFF 305830 TaxID=933852 RepID=A0A0C3BP79_SERVB|nr:hypothetical protein M408DRAFT_326031 [Serendipita vermifera MAFF 305830]